MYKGAIMTITFETLMETIGRVAAAERITKEGLRTLSRDILAYVAETEDVRPVNALLGMDGDGKFILTPINFRIAVQYFHHFIAFTSNWEEVKGYCIKGKGARQPFVLNKKAKKRWDKSVADITAWLDDETNDIWVWSTNVEMEAKPVDYAKQVQNAVKKALDEEKGNLSVADVLAAIVELDDVSIYDLMGAMEGMSVPEAA
jgi:hypothetical protein